MVYPRKITQIAAVYKGNTYDTIVLALADDGTLWERKLPASRTAAPTWEQIEPLPYRQND